MIDETQTKELVEVLEEVYEVSSTSKDIISGAKTRVKEAKTMMKDWAERQELPLGAVEKVYSEYAAYRDGKQNWGGDDSEDDLFVEMLVAVQDQEIKKKRKMENAIPKK